MQQIDYDAIVKNATFFKQILRNSRFCAVLKSNAYGHGIVRTASALSGIADFFAVGSVSEALLVEQFCPNVLVLLPVVEKHLLQTAVEHNFVLTIDSFYTFSALKYSLPRGKKARVHLKINTGMNRLGFSADELPTLLKQDFSNISVEGVFSHFWGETEKDCDSQLQLFLQASETLSWHFRRPLVRHIANTSGVLLSSAYHLDMVRIGLGLYGYGAPNLVTAKTVFAKVLAVHGVSAGETVGYGAAHTFVNNTNVAVINAGYSTGFCRALKNSCVKINGKVFPIVGNICMSMLMVDVGSASVKVGDNAILLGQGINNANCNVIVYELLCNLQ